MKVPHKAKSRSNIYSSSTILGHISEEYESGYNIDTCILMFIAALFTIA
jgi:hypothetical protein